MAIHLFSSYPCHFLITLMICCFLVVGCNSSKSDDDDGTADQKVYIVYMGDLPTTADFSVKDQHASILQKTLANSERASKSLIHSYHRSFNGFVAKLTEDEKNRIASFNEVVSVFPNRKLKLGTTRSWDFIGFPLTSPRTTVESDIIIGMIDSGIWPESPSFDDSGLGPPPARWNGTCQSSANFTCNNKIIGARYYHTGSTIPPEDSPTPRDTIGHGTHTSSIAAGRVVNNASMIGLARGTARGGTPSSRIAVYKVCWSDSCSDMDILAAMDDAIKDGVDILSLSIQGNDAPHFEDSVGIGSYHGMKKGVLTSTVAGNDGSLGPGRVTNVAPWAITVAANNIDRKFRSKVELGNRRTFEGPSMNTFTLEKDFYPLVYGGDVPADGVQGYTSRYCEKNTLDPKQVKGKIVLCDALGDGAIVANATGTIMIETDYDDDLTLNELIPASFLNASDGINILSYINSTRKPLAKIYKSNEVKNPHAPFVVYFSSRGPNKIDKDILKPDLTAPGVEILAAFSEATSITGDPDDHRVAKYNIDSGTSMSCPHVTGAAAYVKSFNPKWSPSAIKSALMTTATPMTLNDNKEGEFAYGAGQINPLKAKSPGLIYDMVEADYVRFLCGTGYDNSKLQKITGDNSTTCPAAGTSVYDFNYPAFVLSTSKPSPVTQTFHRTVTNVGAPSSTYRAIVKASKGLRIAVKPKKLRFKSIGETKSFSLRVTVRGKVGSKMKHSSLIWDDGKHRVRSPIVVYSSVFY